VTKKKKADKKINITVKKIAKKLRTNISHDAARYAAMTHT
jgi:hypothetical protein